MGKTYNASLQIKAWKQHCCVGCALPYAYVLERNVTASGGNEEAAQKNLRKAVDKSLKTEVDSRPCPNCGLVQPDMIADSRDGVHTLLYVVSLITLALVAILKAMYAVQSTTLSVVAVVLAVIIAAGHVLNALKNPNTNLDANKKTAAGLLSNGRMIVPPEAAPQRTGPAPVELARPPRSVLQTVGMAMALVGVVLVGAPELLRIGKGLPTNADVYPSVVGPGDTTRVYMGQSMDSVKGYWRGQLAARLTADGMQPMDLEGSTNSNNWGNNISVKSSEKSSSFSPWVEVTIPSDDALAGKTVDADIELKITYPKMSGGNTFEEYDSTMQKKQKLILAGPGSGSSYNSTWWGGTAGGFVMLVVAAFVLKASDSAFAKTALPATVIG